MRVDRKFPIFYKMESRTLYSRPNIPKLNETKEIDLTYGDDLFIVPYSLISFPDTTINLFARAIRGITGWNLAKVNFCGDNRVLQAKSRDKIAYDPAE